MMRNDKQPADSPHDKDSSFEVTYISNHPLEAESMKVDIEVNGKKPSGFLSLGEYLRRERHLELFVSHGEELKSCSNSVLPTHAPNMAVLSTLPLPKSEVPTKETDFFYMDKKVTEVGSPKVIICCQKDVNQSVKDICIDEGNNNKDFQQDFEGVEDQKIYMENEVTEEKKIASFSSSDSLYVVQNPVQKDSPESVVDKVNCPPLEELHKEQEQSLAEEIKQEESGYIQTLLFNSIDGRKLAEADQDSLMMPNDTAVQDSSTGLLSEGNSTIPSDHHQHPPPPPPPPHHVQENTSSSDIVVNRETSAIATENPNELAGELEQSFQDSTDRTTFPRNALVPQMEVGVHGPSCLSDKVIHTAQGAYSGSISHRSESSSTRSFAFPTLQSEWTTSPVKMAKPDRRHYRKHQGWRAGVLCCRF